MPDDTQNDTAPEEERGGSQGSPRYVDETTEADKNLRPDPEEAEERGTDREPLPKE